MTLYLLEIIIFLAIVIADSLGLVPLSQTILLFPFVLVSLYLRRESWSSIGFNRSTNMIRAIAVGILAGIALELFAVLVTTPLISSVTGVEPDYSELREIQGNFGLLVIFIVLPWVLAAFGEEVTFRGFLMKRIVQVLNETPAAWVISLLLSSILFGWGHTEQGISGWLQEGLSGFLLGVLFLTNRKNLVVPIVAHGVSNTLAFVLIYLGQYPGMG